MALLVILATKGQDYVFEILVRDCVFVGKEVDEVWRGGVGARLLSATNDLRPNPDSRFSIFCHYLSTYFR